jgi:hypothetical protein
MSRPAGRNRSTALSDRASPRDGRGARRCRSSGLPAWLAVGRRLGLAWLLLALVLIPSTVFAQARGVDVRPMDARVFTVDPREVVTVVFQVTNRMGGAADLEGRLLMPAGWRAITPEFPFTLPPGGTVMRLVSFFVPEGTAAGEYRVSYQVGIRGRPGALGGSTLNVRVRPVFKLQVDILELPTIAIANEPYKRSSRSATRAIPR